MHAFKQLLPLFKPYRGHMVVVLLSALTVTGMSLVGPWIVRELIRLVDDGTARLEPLLWLSAVLLGSFLFKAFGQYLQAYVAHIMAWNFVSDLQSVLYRHLQTLSMRFYANRQTGELMSRVTSDTRDLEPMIAHTIPDGIVYSLMIAGVSGALFFINPTLTLMVLLPMPVLGFVVHRVTQGEQAGFRRTVKTMGRFHAKVQDNLSGIKEIQIFSQEPSESRRVHALAKTTTDQRIHALKLQAMVPSFVELAAGVGTAMVVGVGGWMALGRTLPVEDLVAFLLYLALLYTPIRVLAYMNEGFQMALAGAHRVAEILELEPDVVDPPGGISPTKLDGHIVFKSVSFSYLEDQPILKDISLEVKPGQVLALVGPTGAGKTTLASLVARFYDPTSGKVLVDGIDLKNIRLGALRQHVSMVSQDVFLFSGTVRDNLRFSKPQAGDGEVEEAARAASAHEFIRELPDGYDTKIGERGIKLSGGQKQRLAIARALLKDAPILVLDEATSAVDTQTETHIQAALWLLMQGRTSIVIAHRLSTVHQADLIAVLDGGRVVELGNHQTLIERDGLYRQLHERQFSPTM